MAMCSASSSQPEVSILVFLCVGHEHPYCIQVNNLRNRMGAVALKKDVESSLLQQYLITEPGRQEMGCKFILKPRQKARTRSGE